MLARHAASSIVNVGSVSGLTHVRTGAPYGMAKAALHQMTRNLAVEWAEDGVRVNGTLVAGPGLEQDSQGRPLPPLVRIVSDRVQRVAEATTIRGLYP